MSNIINHTENRNVEDVDDYYGSCCSTRVSTLEEDMEGGANALHDFEALFLRGVKLG